MVLVRLFGFKDGDPLKRAKFQVPSSKSSALFDDGQTEPIAMARPLGIAKRLVRSIEPWDGAG
jgi:hypothetical protein